MQTENKILEINQNLYEIYSINGYEYVHPGKFHISIKPQKNLSEIKFKLFRNMRNGVPDYMNELIRGTLTLPCKESLQLQKNVLHEALIRELQQNKTQTHILPPELIQDILDLHFLEQKNAALLN